MIARTSSSSPELQALPGDVGAEDVDVALAGSLLGRRETGLDVRKERHTRHRVRRRVVRHDEGRAGPRSAECTLLVGAPIRVVAAEGAAADEQGADVRAAGHPPEDWGRGTA